MDPTKDGNVREAFYSAGLTITCKSGAVDVDTITAIAFDASSILNGKSESVEMATVTYIEGQVFGVCEIEESGETLGLGECLNELATQLSLKPKRVMLLTNAGMLSKYLI